MKKDFFSPENPLNGMLVRLFDLFVLNILWMLACIPVITISASTAALYTLTFKWANGEEIPVLRGFWEAFRANLRQGIGVTILLLAAAGILVADFHLLGGQTEAAGSLLYGACFVLLLGVAAVFSYVFPLMARFENTIAKTFDNAWRLAAAHLLQTTAILLVNGAPLAWFLISPGTFMAVFWVWMVAGAAVSAYICTLILNPIFKKLM